MDKFTVARLLDEISRYVELSDPKPFRARAFERAARAIENLEEDVAALVKRGEITSVSGVGKATGEIVEEIVRTGTAAYLEELRGQYPRGIFDLLRVPKLGLKKVGVLYTELGIGSLDQLEAAALDGRLAGLKGFGAKTAELILKGIAFARMRTSQYLLPVGLEVGEMLRERLADFDEIEDVDVTGSVRRRLEVIRTVDIVIATKKPAAVMAHLATLVDQFEEVDERTAKGVSRSEVDVSFHLVPPTEFGTAILRTTGSEEFVEALDDLPKGRTEADVFKKLDVPFVEPELRESAAVLTRKKRTKLVTLEDLRGTFHVHTTFSDGRNTVKEMLGTAKERGLEYVGLSDHSKSAYYAGGLTDEGVREQQAEIARQEEGVAPMRVFRGTEADILPDGTMDYGPAVMKKFDFVIASVHSQFQMDVDAMTERILRAMDNPYVTFLGHLTGRKLLAREGYRVDYDRIFEKAGERGVMIEINGNPNRLDLDWRHVQRALDRGVVFSINPDAHSTSEYNALITGTWVARKAGLSAKQIFNTKRVEEVEEWFRLRRSAAGSN